MFIKRVALVFDPRPRPETTGSYCLRALQKRLDVTHLLPEQVASAESGRFDLFLRIDDGLRCPWPGSSAPSAYWAIDTHLDFEWALEESGRFDFVFAAQRDGVQELERLGIKHALWLPLACDPEIHRSGNLEKIWDVSFVGHVLGGERQRLLELIRQRFPKGFIGQKYFKEMAKVYAQSKIVFNRSVRNDVNMRVFEALASGSLLITNDLESNGQAELFRDQEHLVVYGDDEELFAKIACYLANDALREGIAQAGQKEVLAKHTYDHRMEQLLEEVETQLAKRQDLGQILSEESPKHRDETAKSPMPMEETSKSPGMRDKLQRAMPSKSHAPGWVKDSCYFEFPRPEVLALVPTTAQRILEIGCGAGRLGEALKKRQQAEVIGVELNAEAARRAAGRLDQVVLGNIETDEFRFTDGSFDTVICADVLEHLRNPLALLKRVRSWLSPSGVLVVSLPNVRNWTVIASLLEGNWTYEAAGLLDEDHVRSFTKREMEKLLFRAGFEDVEFGVVPGPR